MAVPGPVKLKRIAAAVDGSEASTHALRLALRLTAHHGPRVRLLAVLHVPEELAPHPDLAKEVRSQLRRDADAHVARASELVKAAGLEADGEVLEGHPAEQLAQAFRRERPHLAVLGHRGLGGPQVHLVGSVGYAVAHFASVPVLIAAEDRPLRKVLVPLDGSEPSLKAVDWAADLALAQHASVTLLFVIPQGIEEVKFTVTRAVKEPFLGPLMKALKDRGVQAGKRIEYGHPAEVIANVAQQGSHDLIVMGHRGLGGAAGFALGGVTDKVLHRAPCPTLVVR